MIECDIGKWVKTIYYANLKYFKALTLAYDSKIHINYVPYL